jgi:pyruvate,orthophosphate dikinase
MGAPSRKTSTRIQRNPIQEKLIYFYEKGHAEGSPQRKDLLGNKGAGLAEMAVLEVPVPPGFTISTRVCKIYEEGGGKLPASLEREVEQYMHRLEEATGFRFGDPAKPLLVSVRSGAAVSMPGMMDTILNVGLNDETVEGLARNTKDARFAYDCYRRLIVMFASTVRGVDKAKFEHHLEAIKNKRKATADSELGAEDVKRLVEQFKRVYKSELKEEFPQDVWEQLRLARDAVFRSWNSRRAIEYRRLYNIPSDLGTAVNVVSMVFGNMGDDSGTGVGFTRDPATGADVFYGEFLANAQGEDVVAGIRTPRPLSELRTVMPAVAEDLRKVTKKLEQYKRDVQDFEFTIQKGQLFLLQTRTGKRTGFSALRIAVDMCNEGVITPEEAVMRVDCDQLQAILHPVFDPQKRGAYKPIAKGLNASPGAASGKVVFDPDEAVELSEKGEKVILVRPETSADDVHGMARAQGILTCKGGFTSHAAVVARQMGKPSVVGCEEIEVREEDGRFVADGVTVQRGDYISIDGQTGEVMVGSVPLRESSIILALRGELAPDALQPFLYYSTFMEWVDGFRRLQVRANADHGKDSKLAIQLGAEGIGLCRTEHMFFAEERLPIVREMILAETDQERRDALRKLLPFQIQDFLELFEVMGGLPVTIRTIDPPLHEFLPSREEVEAQISKAKDAKARARAARLLERVHSLQEMNPMMGHRGCRLGITYPEITEMQAEAIFEAALQAAAKTGKVPVPEVMIPLVSQTSEFIHQRDVVQRVANGVFHRRGRKIPYRIGTMIETPRAALISDALSEHAEFYSFGTNDLTQLTYGFSRDDAGKFISHYLKSGIMTQDPFVTLDEEGVGQLVELTVRNSRKSGRAIKVGICGEQGGEEKSVAFCHRAGLDYVSCSPYRVPVARLAAAQAAIKEAQRK